MAERSTHIGQNKAAATLMAWLLAAVVLCVIGLASPAHAADPIREYQYGYDENSSATSGLTDLTFSGSFSCNADGTTNGTLFVNPQCESTGLIGVFANVVCRIENLFGTILGLIYCAVHSAIIAPLLALFTLYVTIYGAMVILGMVGHTFGEAISRVFKIALVSAIAMNADIAIGVGYKFYIGAAQTGVGIVFDIFDAPTVYDSNPAAQEMIAAGYMASPYHADESRRLKSGSHWLESIDATIHKMIGFFVEGGVGLLVVMGGLFIFMPPLFFIVVYLVLSIFKAFAQAIIGYLLALLGITFLFTIAPIFVSFALFRVTAGYFETWLKHLASFTLQLMIVFTFFMLILMIDLVTFLQNLGMMVRQYQHVFSFGFLHYPITVYTMCRVEREGGMHNGDIRYFKFDASGELGAAGEGSRYEGFPRCVPEYTLADLFYAEDMPPSDSPIYYNQQRPRLMFSDRDQVDAFRDMADQLREQANSDDPDVLAELAPNADQIPPGDDLLFKILAEANHQLKIPFFQLLGESDLIFFLLVRFIVVIILTYLLDSFMKNVPSFANVLAGTEFSGRLGGGENAIGEPSPGVQGTGDFGGVDTAFARFKQAAFSKGYYSEGFVRSAPMRFARGMRAAVGGAGESMLRKSLANAGSLGMRQDLKREMSASAELLGQRRLGMATPDVGRSRGPRRGGLHNPASGGAGTVRRNTMWSGR